MDPIQKLSDTFLIETNKLLDEFSALLLKNESAREFTPAEIGEMFRIVHTIKGSVGMMNLSAPLALAHALEDLFVLLKGGGGLPGPQPEDLFDLLFEALDALRGALRDFSQGDAGEASFDGLIRRIASFRDAKGQNRILRVRLTQDCAMQNVRAFLIISGLRGVCPSLSHYPEGLDRDPGVLEKIRDGGLYISFPPGYEDTVREALTRELYIQSVEPAETFPQQGPPPEPQDLPSGVSAPAREGGGMENYVSVHLSKLEELQTLASELTLAQNKLFLETGAGRASETANKLRRLCGSLQGTAASLRMVPVSELFQRLHRTVREAGRKLGRDMEFIAAGGDVEIDKSILEPLSEALVQIVRNAAVHGIEDLDERLAAGKPLMGRITVSARSSGMHVVVTVQDDGRGVCAKTVMEAARDARVSGEAPPKTAAALLELIMRPGVTTNLRADEMSGRGVGLDVVRTAVEKLRGSVAMETQVGSGTVFSLRIPQSLAVMDCICLGVGASVFLLPASDIYALTRPREEDVMRSPGGRRLLRYKDYSLPLLDLGTFYRVREAGSMDAGVCAILEGEDNALALYADRPMDLVRAQIKPLPALLDRLGVQSRGISGCTVLGDGSLGLVLDAETLLKLEGM